MNVENEKCVIVVDENLPLGIIANTAAILGITMCWKMPLPACSLSLTGRPAEGRTPFPRPHTYGIYIPQPV